MIWKAAQIQDATTGPVSVAEWFYTNESKTCPVPLDPLMATPLRDLACYFGPGMGYPKAGGFLLRGEWAEVHGQSLLGDWLALADLDGFTSCWLPLEAVETTGDPSELRKLNPPLIVEETREPGAPVCTAQLSQEECKAAGGIWYKPPTGGPDYCKCD